MTREEVSAKLVMFMTDDPMCSRAYLRALALIDKMDEIDEPETQTDEKKHLIASILSGLIRKKGLN